MYPLLEIFPDRIENNARVLSELLHSNNFTYAGVVKGCNGIPEVIRAFVDGGVDYIADSRIQRFSRLREIVPELPLMLLRLPARDEVELVVRHADISLNSQLQTVHLLNEEARRQHRKHSVVMMAEMGDIREGVYPAELLVDQVEEIEAMSNVELAGIGTNLSCLGGVVPDEENMGSLVALAEKVEGRIGRSLNIVSGGATTSLPLFLDGGMPQRINHLRVGETILLGREVRDFWNHSIAGLRTDTFILHAQVIEVMRKPSTPTGKIHVDAFGHTPAFPDRGIRTRAIAAIGKTDIVYPEFLIPEDPGIEIIAASSDHLTLDVENASRAISLGDIVSFSMFYGPMLYLTCSPLVEKRIVAGV